jgi:hypothetical protein
MGAGGTKLPRSSPCSNSPGQPGGVADIGLAAGQGILTWRALTNSNSKFRSSSTYQIGFQQLAGGSITTWVTPSAASQSASASSPQG